MNIPRNRISIRDIEALCLKISRSAVFDYFTFIWHGGEPLLMGVDFYKEVINIQKKILYPGRYKNTFQTNGTLINDDWLSFFIENKIKVSTSLDGIGELHDNNRRRNGKGTFEEVLRNINRLQSASLFAGVVTVLSKTNLGRLNDILCFYAANNIPTRINPILPSERVIAGCEDLSINATEYADSLIDCFDNWIKGCYNTPKGKPLRIAPLTEIIHNFFYPDNPRPCMFAKKCSQSFLAINPIGDLYNCGRFSDIPDYKIANIRDRFDCIDEILDAKSKSVDWNLASSKNDRCIACEWFSICNRGCPSSSYIYSGKVADKDPYCEGYKKLFSHMYDCLEKNI